MDTLLAPMVDAYRYTLTPVAPFTWFGIGISTLDLVATVRLCVALRQLREYYRGEHLQALAAQKKRAGVKGKTLENEEERSFVRDLAATLVVVYGGESMSAPLLGLSPSYMVSGVVPVMYAAFQAAVEHIPSSFVPTPSFGNELPLAVVDALTRAYLLCSLIPPSVLTHSSPVIAASPWTLLLTALITANGGFFLTNLFSFFQPTALRVATPTELMPYGWTTTDLWCAPLITGLYALLTHAQPFWADAHNALSGVLGSSSEKTSPQPVDSETARAACALVLTVMFTTRATRNFGGKWLEARRKEVGSAAQQKRRVDFETDITDVAPASTKMSLRQSPRASSKVKTQ